MLNTFINPEFRLSEQNFSKKMVRIKEVRLYIKVLSIYLWLGEYEECINITVKSIEFQGKYCVLTDPSIKILVHV